MTTLKSFLILSSLLPAVLGLLATAAQAQTQLITNGTFEATSLIGWSTASQTGSTGTFQIGDNTQTNAFGPISPVEQFNNAGSSGGRYYAVTDSLTPSTDGPSAMVLYQNINLTNFLSFSSATLTFDMAVQDYSGAGPLNASLTTPLDYTQATPTQFVRVDMLRQGALGADAFTIASDDVLQSFFMGGSSTTTANYTSYSVNVTNLLNQRLQSGDQSVSLRFAVVSGGGFYHANVDSVSILATGAVTTPEPGPLGYLLVAGMLLIVRRRLR